MSNLGQKLITRLAPILGAGAIGVCPLCWIGSASLLTYLGLGALISWWRWIGFGFIVLGGLGFVFDYRSHKNPRPLIALIVGGILLYVGRYVFVSTWGAWQIWGPGALLIIAAIMYNKWLFRKPKEKPQINLYQCPECGFHYQDEALAKKCQAWCKEHKSCNIEITARAEESKKP